MIHSLMLVHLSQSLPGKSRRIAHILSAIDHFSSCSSYYRSNQSSKRNNESSSTPMKDIDLFYCLVRILLFTTKVIRPNVQDYVTSLLTIMELPMNHYKNRLLSTDILSMKKIRMFVLSSLEDKYNHFET